MYLNNSCWSAPENHCLSYKYCTFVLGLNDTVLQQRLQFSSPYMTFLTVKYRLIVT